MTKRQNHIVAMFTARRVNQELRQLKKLPEDRANEISAKVQQLIEDELNGDNDPFSVLMGDLRETPCTD